MIICELVCVCVLRELLRPCLRREPIFKRAHPDESSGGSQFDLMVFGYSVQPWILDKLCFCHGLQLCRLRNDYKSCLSFEQAMRSIPVRGCIRLEFTMF